MVHVGRVTSVTHCDVSSCTVFYGLINLISLEGRREQKSSMMHRVDFFFFFLLTIRVSVLECIIPYTSEDNQNNFVK